MHKIARAAHFRGILCVLQVWVCWAFFFFICFICNRLFNCWFVGALASFLVDSFAVRFIALHRIKKFIAKLRPRVGVGHVTLLIVFKYLNLIKLIGLSVCLCVYVYVWGVCRRFALIASYNMSIDVYAVGMKLCRIFTIFLSIISDCIFKLIFFGFVCLFFP